MLSLLGYDDTQQNALVEIRTHPRWIFASSAESVGKKWKKTSEHSAKHHQINVFVSTDCMNISTG